MHSAAVLGSREQFVRVLWRGRTDIFMQVRGQIVRRSVTATRLGAYDNFAPTA